MAPELIVTCQAFICGAKPEDTDVLSAPVALHKWQQFNYKMRVACTLGINTALHLYVSFHPAMQLIINDTEDSLAAVSFATFVLSTVQLIIEEKLQRSAKRDVIHRKPERKGGFFLELKNTKLSSEEKYFVSHIRNRSRAQGRCINMFLSRNCLKPCPTTCMLVVCSWDYTHTTEIGNQITAP